jgi:hypothetical protein
MKALCEGLGELGVWTRLHYVYPYPHVDDIIPLMAEGKILPYLDIPFQHASPRVLKLMKRPGAVDKTLERIQRWRAICPELTIRSTFIVGFPGETEAEFEELLDFLDEAQLDRVGAFAYSPVDGAKANELPDPVTKRSSRSAWRASWSVRRRFRARARLEESGHGAAVLVDAIDGDSPSRARWRMRRRSTAWCRSRMAARPAWCPASSPAFGSWAATNTISIKAALNARQVADIARVGKTERSRAQCALTQFDEAGVIVVLRDPALLPRWDAHDWQGLFWHERAAWRDGRAQLVVFGHALLEHALQPHPIHTAKCIAVQAGAGEPVEAATTIGAQVAAAIAMGDLLNDPQESRPLPLSGLPGWHPESGQEGFFHDAPCFRPLRAGRRYPPPWQLR